MNEDIGIQIIILIVLLFLSGFFSSSETALVAVNRIKIRTLAEEGSTRAKTLLKIFENEAKMLSAILIGNNLVNTYAASIAATIAYSFGGAAVSVATFIITFLILVFGEITPKTLAAKNSEKLALFFAPIISMLMKVLTPAIWFVNIFSNLIIHLLGASSNGSGTSMTESELRTIVDVSHEEGVIEKDEKEMINKVFDLGDAIARDVMVPRVYVVSADVNSSYEDLIRLFRQEKFTRIPIYEGNVDNIIGLVNMKDLLLYENLEKDKFEIHKILRKPYFTVENKKVSELLIEMKQSTFNLAIVLDEYGELAGIVSLEDIVEEIVGEVQDEYDAHEMENIKKIDELTYDVKGFISLHDLNDELELKLDSEDFDSIGGLVIDKLGRLPNLNDEVVLENGIVLQVQQIHRNRIEQIRMRLPQPKQKEEDAK